MSKSFDLGNRIRRQKNGIATPPNEMARVAPPKWNNVKMITATTSTEVVPQNVYQILVMVWGGGGNSTGSASGGGGGFSTGIIDVVPNQLLPTITVGSAQGTSSFSTLLSSTGASGMTAGTGTANTSLRSTYTANGGIGFNGGGAGGAAGGSPLGTGGSPLSGSTNGGAAWGGISSPATTIGGTTPISGGANNDGLLAIANKTGLSGIGGISATAAVGIGCGAFSQANAEQSPISPLGGGGAYGATTPSKGGIGGGGAGSGGSGTTGGAGLVLLFWTEGF